MSIIGTVSHLIGRAVAVKADGSERELALGDQVFADELVRVSPDGALEIAMEAGDPVILEGGQSWLATADTYQDSEQFDTSEAVADIDSIQAAILAGADPTEVAEETAAGGEGEADGNEGSSIVQIIANREEVDPTAGFETIGFASEFPEVANEELLATVPQISINDVSVEEPDTNPFVATTAGDATAIVTTFNASEGDLFTFDWNFIDGDGGFFNDFSFVSIDGQLFTLADLLGGEFVGGETGAQTFSIELGAGSHTIAIGVADVGDSIVHSPLEVSNVTLNGSPIAGLNFSGGLGDWTAIGSATIDGGVVTLASTANESDVEAAAGMVDGAIDAQAALNASGYVIATFTVSLDKPTNADVTVDFTTADGTAIAGGSGIAENDYGSTSGTVTIPAGSTSATVQVYVYGDNYQEGDEQFFLNLSNPDNAVILDDTGVGTVLDNDEIIFTLTASDEYFGEEQEEFLEIPTETSNSVFEGGTANYMITLTGANIADGQVIVLDLDVQDGTALYLDDYSDISNVSGAVSFNPTTNQLTIEGPFNVGDVVASFSISTVDDAFAENTEQFTVALTAASEGTAQGTVTTTIYDDSDTTTVTLTGANVNEGAGTATVSASVNNAPETDLVLTLSTGDTITILAGETSGSTEVNINNDEDVYLDASELAISITNAAGGNYESLNTSDTTTVSVADTIDDTTLTLDNVTVAEGAGTAIISAELSAAPTDGPVEFTLSNGATIKFEIGETTATSSEFSVQGDDVYVDGATTTVSVSSYTGGDEYENLVTTDTADVTVEDTTDDTTLTLDNVTVAEGSGTATISAELSAAPTDGPVEFTLSNGSTITFEIGETTATSTEFPVQDDDVFVDGENYTVSVSSYTGGAEYENLVTTDTAEVTIEDTTDDTTLTLNNVTVAEGSGTATISAELSTAPTGGPVEFTLSNGSTITFEIGETTATSTEFPVQGDDVFVDGENYTVSVNSYTGGAEYENLVTTDTSEVTIEDTTDDTTLTLDNVTVAEGAGTATISAELSAAPTDGPVEFTLSNGATIKFGIGETTATSSEFSVQGDDVYVDGATTTVSVSSYTGGDEYENLVTTDTADVTVEDTTDTVTATLSTTTVEISEDGGSITYVVTLSGAPGSVDPDNDLVFTLTNPDGSGDPIEVTVAAGATTGQTVVNYSDAEITNQTSFDNSIASFTGGTEYEDFVTAGSTSVPVDYKPEISNLTPSAQGGDVTVDEDDLPAGSDGTESVTQSGTFSVAAVDGIKTLTVGSLTVIDNGSYEGDGINITTPEGHTFTITDYDDATGIVSYTYTLNENESHDPVQGENALFENLSVYLEDTDGDSTTDTLSARIVDDIPAVVATAPGEISYELTITNHDYESSAGYNSSYGYYIKDANGNPTEGHVIWDGVQDAEADTASVTITGYTPDQVGFFIIPNGNNLNSGLEDGTDVTFSFVNGQWQASADGTPLTGAGSHVLFDVAALNLDGQGHVVDNALDGNQNWEDLQIPTGDGDYNDVNVNAEWTALSHLRVDETALTESASTSSLSVDYSGQFTLTPGADGIASLVYELSVGGNSGLYDTATDSEVLLRVNAAGEVEGYVNANDIVFTLTVDESGVATLTQFRAVKHDDPADHDETVSPATVLAGAITLSAVVTDGDGDESEDGFDIGVLLAFEDDGPVAAVDTIDTDEDTSIIIDVLANDSVGADGAEITSFTQPENGEVVLNDNGTFTFTPSVNLHGQETFTYTLTDGDGDTSTTTVTVNVEAVADNPSLIVSVGEAVVNSSPQTIDISNVTSVDNGFVVTAYDIDGDEAPISTVSGTRHDGFGVMGVASGAHTEIGSNETASERLKVEFGNAVSSIGVSFAWLSGIETANYTFYLEGVAVGSGMTAFQSDKVDGVFVLSPVSGSEFDRVDFTAPLDYTDDYLVNSITFEKAESYTYDVDIRASLTDVDGSEALGDITLSSLPEGVSFDGSSLISESPLTEAQINSITASVKSTETSNSDEAETITNAKVEFSGLDATGESADLLIEGTPGADAIIGGDGDDIIFGGAGDDTIAGGSGNDLFILAESDADGGTDTLTDFAVDLVDSSAENDVLDLSDLLSDGANQLIATEVDGHMQLTIADVSDASDVKQVINLDTVSVLNDADAAVQLDQLLANGNIDDGIS